MPSKMSQGIDHKIVSKLENFGLRMDLIFQLAKIDMKKYGGAED